MRYIIVVLLLNIIQKSKILVTIVWILYN